MTRRMPVIAIPILGLLQATATADCPSGYADEIFCDDFDTYCDGGGMPGGAGVPKGADCPTGTLETPEGLDKLHQVWYPTSTNQLDGTSCGTQYSLLPETEPLSKITSIPLGGDYENDFVSDEPAPLGQQTLRDWINSPSPGEPDQILNISHLIENRFGAQYEAVAGTDEHPLVLEFLLSCRMGGKLAYTSGFLELAYGDPTDDAARANTDYVMSPDCLTYCTPGVKKGPFPIMCAFFNPYSPLPSGCPPVSSAPTHKVIAVGALAMLDENPCHCGNYAHNPTNEHPALYNGKGWYMIRRNNPVANVGTGTITPVGDAPMPPPSEIASRLDNFTLNAALADEGGVPVGHPYNWVTLTIKTDTMDLELLTRTIADNKIDEYLIYSKMTGIPRAYKYDPANNLNGAFDTIRGGVGPGCVLANNSSWLQCESGTARSCINQNGPQQKGVVFDDLTLRGGIGHTTKGACCLSNGTCVDNLPANECSALSGGSFRGENTTCGDDDAVCKGACCYPTSCEDGKRITECPSLNYQGYGSTCAQGCPCLGHFGDIDADGDVDQADFAVLQSCYVPGPPSSVCRCFDSEPNNVVTMDDVAAFEACASGPGIPFNPDCDGQ